MDGTTPGKPLPPAPTSSRRPTGLVRQVALMAAHRDSLATPDGDPAPLAQNDIERIVDRLSADPKRRGQAGQH